MQKLEEKALKKNWKNWTTRLACNPGLARTLRKRANSHLGWTRPIKKPKGVLSVKARAKREVSVKSKLYLSPIKRSRKHKEKTQPTHREC